MELVTAEIENLKGYEYARFEFNNKRQLIVGKNNSGKTSLFKIIDWALNLTPSKEGTYEPSTEEKNLLVPARATRNRARRLTLRFHQTTEDILDSPVKSPEIILRFNLRVTPTDFLYIALGNPTKGESPLTQRDATTALSFVRERFSYHYIPSFRDGGSDRFKASVSALLRSKLSQDLLSRKPGAKPTDKRKIEETILAIGKIATKLIEPAWSEINQIIPSGLTRDGELKIDISEEDIISLICQKTGIKISTGTHDEDKVIVKELGSGLQSILDIAINLSSESQNTLFVIDEPESFLHPSAQRTLATSLFNSSQNHIILISHSTIFSQETKYENTTICKGHKFFQADQTKSPQRKAINSSLLRTSHGSEMLFSDAVILVEGESDKGVIENFRRKLSGKGMTNVTKSLSHDLSLLNNLFVVPVGSKTSFAPWIELIESFGKAIKWLVVADGDASSEAITALTNAGGSAPAALSSQASTVGSLINVDKKRWASECLEFNRIAASHAISLRLFECDLEFSLLSAIDTPTLANINTTLNTSFATKIDLLSHLGSKGVVATGDTKHPWMRALIADQIKNNTLTPSMKDVVLSMLELVDLPRDERVLVHI